MCWKHANDYMMTRVWTHPIPCHIINSLDQIHYIILYYLFILGTDKGSYMKGLTTNNFDFKVTLRFKHVI